MIKFFKIIMKDDEDQLVAVESIKLLTTIIKFNEIALEERDCKKIYRSICSKDKDISKAAGSFLIQKHFSKEIKTYSKYNCGMKQSQNSILILRLLYFAIENQLEDNINNLVDSLWTMHHVQ
jgi:hypothetical protein